MISKCLWSCRLCLFFKPFFFFLQQMNKNIPIIIMMVKVNLVKPKKLCFLVVIHNNWLIQTSLCYFMIYASTKHGKHIHTLPSNWTSWSRFVLSSWFWPGFIMSSWAWPRSVSPLWPWSRSVSLPWPWPRSVSPPRPWPRSVSPSRFWPWPI